MSRRETDREYKPRKQLKEPTRKSQRTRGADKVDYVETKSDTDSEPPLSSSEPGIEV